MRKQLTAWLAAIAMMATATVTAVGSSGCVRYAAPKKKPAKACPYKRSGRSTGRGRGGLRRP